MDNSTQLRELRIISKIPGIILCNRAGISRARLSQIEREHVAPKPDELARIHRALEQLMEARQKVVEFARSVDFPL